ncbi:hypothetical protein HAHE_09620 [Haloferula helveola]|uniref:Uncharacterized protein n=1 Tax=Haloferula helveola TaxID=490095 RepID=A0ABN6H3C1_9BACT|nr:hypothetical protein HAHE_09620 [Haloferula helveola]
MKAIALLAALAGTVSAASTPVTIEEPSEDRWMYPSNSTPGSRAQASTFSALPDAAGLEDRWGFFLLAFDTTVAVPAGLPPESYRIRSISLRATTGQDQTFEYDPTYDPVASYGTPSTPVPAPDSDIGRPVELHGAGFRNGFTAASFSESSPYGSPERNAYPLGFDSAGTERDVSWNVTQGFESRPWAVGTTADVAPGDPVPLETEFHFEINPNVPGIGTYLRQSLADGKLWLTLSSLHPAIQQGGELASWLTRDDSLHILFGDLAPQLTLDVEIDLPLTITSGPAGPVLSWPQFSGYSFVLQASPDLSEESWQPVHTADATDDTPGSFTDTAGLARRFYRLEFTPTP